MFHILADPLYEPLLEPCEPAFGRAHDFVLHKFGQQIPPIAEQSVSCKHFGVHVDICDDNGHSPKSMSQNLFNFIYIENLMIHVKRIIKF